MEEAKWYVVHTYSGYENKVKEDLIKAVENRNLQDMILEVKYPTEEVVEIKDGKRKVYQRKVFPGYVMVKMIMNDKTWYVVRNTRGVTGFVGPGSKPIPLSDEEVTAMGVERIPIELDIEVGESVRVVSGPLENFIGTVEALDPEPRRSSSRFPCSAGIPRWSWITSRCRRSKAFAPCTCRIMLRRDVTRRCIYVGAGLRPLAPLIKGETKTNGKEDHRLHQAADPCRQGNAGAARRSCPGPARR